MGVTESQAQAPDLESGLRRFGHTSFRTGQREAVETLLNDGKLLLVAPTGGGKSLTYQLPATLLRGTTLVVSPLIALMNDQVASLEAQGIHATFFASTLDPEELDQRTEKALRGEYQLIYVAPERVLSMRFQRLLAGLECPLVAIDEAHCISEWGHDFRPEYLQLRRLLERLPNARVLACTATATPIVRDEILSRLGLGPDTPQVLGGFARPNLILRAREVAGAKERGRHVDAILEEALGSPEKPKGTAIIYGSTRKATEAEAARLAALGWKADAYHAGLFGEVRDDVQRRFIDGELQIVVATNAFGMGIDRGDVRLIVHLAPPGSMEAYYQEVGRAGRDGETAHGLLLWAPQDVPFRRRLLETEVDGRPVAPEVVEHKWSLFLELMRWAEGGACRHDAILRYFGSDEASGDGCGRCDVCTEIETAVCDPDETQMIVQKALSGVARVHGRFGMGMAAKLLKGASEPRLVRAGLDLVRTYGALHEFSERRITQILRRCVTAGWVTYAGDDRPVLVLTVDGQKVMLGKAPARILLPAGEEKRAVPKGSSRSSRSSGGGGAALPPGAESLFEALRAHRLEVAKEDGVPPYVVASDRTLREIATARPRTRAGLLEVHGIGDAKAERFGDGFLAVVAEAAE